MESVTHLYESATVLNGDDLPTMAKQSPYARRQFSKKKGRAIIEIGSGVGSNVAL